MSCKHWKDDWVARLYDELGPEEERLLEQHLAECAECAHRLDELEASRHMLREACPEIPATPSVVVLRPRWFFRPGWAFAAGAACATLVLALGLAVGYRLPGAASPPGQEPGRSAVAAVATPGAGSGSPSEDPLQTRLDPLMQRIETLEAGLAACNTGRDEGNWVSRAQFDEEIARVERRADVRRARDFEFLLAEIGAAELRTGTYLNKTREALQMVAMRTDPRLTER